MTLLGCLVGWMAVCEFVGWLHDLLLGRCLFDAVVGWLAWQLVNWRGCRLMGLSGRLGGSLAGELMAQRRDVRLSGLTHGWVAGWRVGHRSRDLENGARCLVGRLCAWLFGWLFGGWRVGWMPSLTQHAEPKQLKLQRQAQPSQPNPT